MGFRVDYSALDTMYYTMCSDVGKWNEALNEVTQKTKALEKSRNMSGSGANNVRSYLELVHETILVSLMKLIKLHIDNCLLYKRDYMTNIDDAIHALIDERELEDLKRLLKDERDDLRSADADVQRALFDASKFFSVACNGADLADREYGIAIKNVDELVWNIHNLEDAHLSRDFIETQQMISALTSFIQSQRSTPRGYKTNLSPMFMMENVHFKNLVIAYIEIDQKSKDISNDLIAATEDEKKRIEILNKEREEYEKRLKKAETEKWVVTGICVIGSIAAIAVIVGTGGAATPLVVGSVSAVSGAVMAGNNAAADQYVESGQIMPSDWGEVGSQAFLGGVTGFISGYVGAGVGGAITNSMSAASSTLVNSSSMAMRIGSRAAIGATSQIISGAGSRGAATFVTSAIETQDVSKSFNNAIHAATDVKSIVLDGVIGGVAGGAKGIKKPPKQITDPKQITKEIKATKPKNSPSPEKWLKKEGGKLMIDSDGTWVYTDRDGITVRYENGSPNFKKAGVVKQTVKVDEIGDYADDFKNADDIAAQRGTPRDAANNTWHHTADGKHLEEIDKAIHKKFTHRGGMSNQKNGIQVETGLKTKISYQQAIDISSESISSAYPGIDQYLAPDYADSRSNSDKLSYRIP